MSKDDLYQRLDSVYEIRLGVKGRKSGRDIPRPVWFVHENNTLNLIPVQGSDTSWVQEPASRSNVEDFCKWRRNIHKR
jgi:hypothetical protein